MASSATAGGFSRVARSRAAVSARSERVLVRAAQGGDAAAVEALFRMHWPAAYRAAWFVVRDAQAAEDIAQEAFLAALAALDRFDRRRPLGPWLRTIVARRSIDALRARALRREVADDALAMAPAPERDDPCAGLDALAAVLAGLSDDQRTVVVLRHVLELTPGEIAQVTGLPRGTVNSRLRRGLDALEAWGRATREEAAR